MGMSHFPSLILRQMLSNQEAIQKSLETARIWCGLQFLFPLFPWLCFQVSGSFGERETSCIKTGLGDCMRGRQEQGHKLWLADPHESLHNYLLYCGIFVIPTLLPKWTSI